MEKPLRLTAEESRRWASSDDIALQELGLGTLLWQHRNSMETWTFLLDFFCTHPKERIQPELIWSLAHIPTHYDILPYFSTGVIDPAIRKAARTRIQRFGLEEVHKLLEFVDENGFERAGIGQSAGAIILLIDDHKKKLRAISSDQNRPSKIRNWAKELLKEYDYLPIHPRP